MCNTCFPKTISEEHIAFAPSPNDIGAFVIDALSENTGISDGHRLAPAQQLTYPKIPYSNNNNRELFSPHAAVKKEIDTFATLQDISFASTQALSDFVFDVFADGPESSSMDISDTESQGVLALPSTGQYVNYTTDGTHSPVPKAAAEGDYQYCHSLLSGNFGEKLDIGSSKPQQQQQQQLKLSLVKQEARDNDDDDDDDNKKNDSKSSTRVLKRPRKMCKLEMLSEHAERLQRDNVQLKLRLQQLGIPVPKQCKLELTSKTESANKRRRLRERRVAHVPLPSGISQLRKHFDTPTTIVFVNASEPDFPITSSTRSLIGSAPAAPASVVGSMTTRNSSAASAIGSSRTSNGSAKAVSLWDVINGPKSSSGARQTIKEAMLKGERLCIKLKCFGPSAKDDKERLVDVNVLITPMGSQTKVKSSKSLARTFICTLSQVF